jgi:hypothetical protein
MKARIYLNRIAATQQMINFHLMTKENSFMR